MTLQRRPRPAHKRASPPKTFNERFEEIALRHPDRIAFRLKTPQGYTRTSYREARAQARAAAAGLLALGLRPGDPVAILSENRPEWVVAYLAAYFAGMIAVPLDTQISPPEWRRLIEDSGSKAVFASGALRPGLEAAFAGAAAPRVISFDPVPDGAPQSTLAGLTDWAAALESPPSLPGCRPDDVVTIIYTSGTTGTPKGVLLTQSNIVGELECIFGAVHADENDALLCLLPLQHVLASVINVLVPLYLGGQVVFADTMKRTEILQALQEAGITILATVPQFFYLFHDRIQEELSRKPAAARKLFRWMLRLNRACRRLAGVNLGKLLFARVHRNFGSKLRLFVSGGSAFDPLVAQEFHDMGFTILQGYGLTETTGACAVTRVESNVLGSVGPALPGSGIRIVSPDESGTGEIAVRGPMVFQGYYKNPQATAEALRDRWFHTGDLGRLDAGGNLFVTGRKKEVIVLPNGKNIYPDELEAHYARCPAIREIAVIGVFGAEERGERLHAVVVPDFDYLKANRIANAREHLRDQITRLSNQLPSYKRLMSYQVQSDGLPRTTTQKIKRLELKRLVESGSLRAEENGAAAAPADPQDAALLESAVGQEVVHCLRAAYHREVPINAGMNLELDLGFDSMERIELLSSLEETLHLELPEDFGAEIHTVRDLVSRLEQQAGIVAPSGASSRRSWNTILAAEAADSGEAPPFRLTGAPLAVFKYACLRLLYRLIFRTLLRLKTRGLDNLPGEGPFLICPNHESYVDAIVLLSVVPYRTFRRTFFLGYSAFFGSGLMSLVARLTNVIPVDPDAHLLAAMKAGAAGLRAGLILCVFPEGGRSFDGSLQAFKKGASILARELSVPVVPAAIRGTHEVWPRDSIRIRPHPVSVEFGKPMFPAPAAGPDPYAVDTERLRDAVAELIRDSSPAAGPRSR